MVCYTIAVLGRVQKIINKELSFMMSLFKRDRDFFDSLFDDFNFTPFVKVETMKTDIKESEKAYEVHVELPGFDKKDVKVSVDNGYLVVEAERKFEPEEEKSGKYIKRERHYGMMKRSFYIGDVSMDTIEGSFNQGVLKLTIPKEIKRIETKKYLELK